MSTIHLILDPSLAIFVGLQVYSAMAESEEYNRLSELIVVGNGQAIVERLTTPMRRSMNLTASIGEEHQPRGSGNGLAANTH
jgi:hypothetical protein